VHRSGGEVAWMQMLEGRSVTSLAADADTLYAASADDQITAITIDEGRVKWEQSLTGVPAPPVLARDRVFVGTSGSALHALDPRNGRTRWRWSLGATVTGILAVFPIVVTSLMAILHPRIGGPATAAVIAHTISGLVGFSLCCLTAHLLVIPLGTPLGLTLALAVSIVANVGIGMTRRALAARQAGTTSA